MQVVARAVMETDAVAHSVGMHALEWAAARRKRRLLRCGRLSLCSRAAKEAVGGPNGPILSYARGASRERVVRF